MPSIDIGDAFQRVALGFPFIECSDSNGGVIFAELGTALIRELTKPKLSVLPMRLINLLSGESRRRLFRSRSS